MNVYEAINAVTAAMAKDGIAKSNKNQQQGYKFRGIDDVYESLSSKLALHKLCILPRVIAREVVDRQSKSGAALIYTTLTVEFDFVSAIDGSKHTICTVGEAMDSADKSSNKAMSAAYKYAAFMAFCIPVVGDNDADATTHELVPVKSSASLKKAGSWEQIMTELSVDMVDVRSLVSFEKLKDVYRERARGEGWTRTWLEQLVDVFEGYKKDILATTEPRELSTLEAG